ncbi:probable C-_U-editing enzyme APOBEC-2 [Oncorhynchus clarkii lewisi]|uniref:probable C->U-editing enzyme APOBEC-2 n=1 Tax=Oncorhynchus clarkii lewisi TaxID=490388 RepID=UPI0039B8C040
MADNHPGWLSVKKREKKGESKPLEKEEEQEKEQKKEKVLKTGYQVVKTGYQHQPGEVRKKEGGGEKTGGMEEITEVAEGGVENGEFETIELPPWEIVTGEQMSPFYFKFQFRNVEYSSGRNKTLLCYRVETPEGATDPLQGYIEDEHATAHVEEAFFTRVLPHYDSSQEYEVRWYVSSSPCAACFTKMADVLRLRKNLRLYLLMSRLFLWEEPEIKVGLRCLASLGVRIRMMKPSDFLSVWETFVEKDEDMTFNPWEDCQDNYQYYQYRLNTILK